MYTWELKDYIRMRNYLLEAREIIFATDIKEHPQLNHILYKDEHYEMWDDDGEHLIFYVKKKVKKL